MNRVPGLAAVTLEFPTPDNMLKRVIPAAEVPNHSQAGLTAVDSPFFLQEHNLIQRSLDVFPIFLFLNVLQAKVFIFLFSDACACISSS